MEKGESLGIGTTKGVVQNVTDPRQFSYKTKDKKKTVDKDYHLVTVLTVKGNFAKVYFPVTMKGTDSIKSNRSLRNFVLIKNEKDGSWISYNLSHPKKIIGYTVEVTGEIFHRGGNRYYMNRVSEFKIHGKA